MKIFLLLGFLGLLLSSCLNSNETSMIQNNEDNISEITQDKQVIIALGDSLTAGYGLDISESYPSKLQQLLSQDGYNYKLVNAGVSGDTSQNLLNRANLYLDQNPDIVLLMIGGNDGLRGQSVDDLKKNIQSIIDMYSGESEIVLGGMEIPANFGLSYTREFKKMYFDIAKENKDIYFLESFLKDVGGVTSLNQGDRIHPTSAGYDIIAQNLYEFLQDEEILQK
ncbi:arylesterase [Candidatus Gracilibacteria bacterium]|nr:arylesterase [Candidatus Gracilibacteria bacterium]